MQTALDDAALSKVSGNARVAVDFWMAMKEQRFDDAADLLDLDGTFWVGAWEPPRTEMSLRVFKWEFHDLLPRMPAEELTRFLACQQFHDAFNGEGDRAVIEMFIDGPLPDGRHQDNVYIFVMRVKNGKIYSVREYADTWWAYEYHGAGQLALWKLLREFAPVGISAEEFETVATKYLANQIYSDVPAGTVAEVS